jgi:hypothetical protein
MEPTSLTIEILKQIRDEMRLTREELSERIDGVSERIDSVSVSLGARIDELRDHMVESEIRTATAITDLSGTVRDMTSVLRSQHDLRPRLAWSFSISSRSANALIS